MSLSKSAAFDLSAYSRQIVKNSPVKASILSITPAMARDWLKLNQGNRTLSKASVEEHVNSILSGDFYLTGETIKFDRDSVMIDGQHRLSACILANQPIESLVVTGLDPRVREVIDGNRKRTNTDVSVMRGADRNTATTAASAVRVLTSLRDKRINGRTSRQTFLKLYDKHGEALKPYALRARDVDRRLATGTVAAITYVLQELMGDAASADKFFHLMHDGSVIEDVAGIPTHVLADKGNPVRMVREWRLKGMRHVNATLLATLAAVNDMREGSSWKRIRSEELPVLDGLDVNLI